MEEQAETAVNPQEFVMTVTSAQNIAAMMDERQLMEIAQQAVTDYELDKDSMSEWFQKMERGLDLARLAKDDKDYPFSGSANIKYPLVLSAMLQFNARAYPAIVQNDSPVKARVWGKDRDGLKARRAERVSEHMSFQLQAQIPEWESETDNLLMILPGVGEMFRKWWYDPIMGRPRCRLIEAGKFIVNDKVKDLTEAPRCSEELAFYPSEIESRVRSGAFLDFEYTNDPEDRHAPQEFIEQHTRLDLDEDGYEEPYVVTVHLETQTVVRLVADYRPEDVTYQTQTVTQQKAAIVQDQATGQTIHTIVPEQVEVPVGILSIQRGTYFVPFKFMPGVDGGFHGTGLGLLLGDISEAINTSFNMLIDAGHFASLGGGWIGSEFRLKGGASRFSPGEWKMTGSKGQDVRSSVVPMTFPGPDATLFQMLGMLIDAGREIASIKDVITGDAPNKQQTATATLALIEQGMMVFTAAYKRIFRSLKMEFKLLAEMNAGTVSPETYQAFHDEEGQVDPQEDYNLADMDIQPVADPRNVTKMQQAAKAQLIMQLAEMRLVDRGEALSRVAQAMDIADVEALMPQPDPMQQMMGQMQMRAAQADLSEKMAKIELTLAQVEETRAQTMERLSNVQNEGERLALEQAQARMSGLKSILEEERERIKLAIDGAGRMAGTSGNGAPQIGSDARNQGPQGSVGGGLFGGQPSPGGLPASNSLGGAMGGGIF